ncbi:MAG: hypothetical protein OXK72_03585 [Gammaproteobacteria bacterium]|nr:hypothetical protein [Gammaproteobacteria bacterium]MDE0410951.1 hypothetical protein [Gammaproteobacteria bacterium]
MRTIQALFVMALWSAVFVVILHFGGFVENHRDVLWALGGAALLIVMLVGNFWIFFAVAKEDPWRWGKNQDS